MVTKASESSDHSRILLDVIVRERKKILKMEKPSHFISCAILGKDSERRAGKSGIKSIYKGYIINFTGP